MMDACSEDDLNSEELQSCLDAFQEVREFCIIESADQCDDEQMKQLEQKLLNIWLVLSIIVLPFKQKSPRYQNKHIIIDYAF